MFARSYYLLLGCLTVLVSAFAQSAGAEEAVDFNRDVRPILSERCFQCHGPDQNSREADLRLDEKAGLFADREDYKLIVPGQPEKSELISRILSADPDLRMPPPASGRLYRPGKKISSPAG